MLLVPRHEQEFAAVGTVAEVTDRVRLPGGARAVSCRACTAASPAPPRRCPTAACSSRSRSTPTTMPVDGKTRNLEREYRAVVEEILELRGDDGRIAAFLRSITEPGSLADTAGYSPTSPSNRRSSCCRRSTSPSASSWRWATSASGWPSSRCASGSARTSSPAPRSSSASTSCASRWSRSARSWTRTTPRSSRSTGPRSKRPGMPEHAREQAEKELGRLERMGEQSAESSVIRTYLDWLIAVPWSEHSEEQLDPAARPRGPRCRSRRAGGRQGPDRRVHRGQEAARRSRHHRGQALRRHPDADRPPRHRQDLDRRVDRPRHRPKVRPHVAGRRPRRGRDPRSPADLHRRAPGPPGPRAAGRRHDEPGDHARRGRQGRRRLARRPERGPARGARPGAEPLVPRSLPGPGARPERGHVHRHRPTSPTRSPARCWTAWR